MDSTITVKEVGAARGAGWLGGGFALFRARPLVWISLCAGWMLITLGLLIVPFVGGVVANFLQPVFFASFAIAARRQLDGEAVEIGELFAGFRSNVRALVNIGALMLIAEIAIFALMALLGFPTAVAGEGDAAPTIADFARNLRGKEWIILAGVVLTAAVKGAFWFAPPLIAFLGLSSGDAIRWSVYAALSNLGAMVVYGLTLAALFFVALVPWGLGLFVALPMMVASTFIGYRDVFEKNP